MKNTPSFWYPGHRRITSTAIILWPLTLLWQLGSYIKKVTTSPYQPQISTIVIGNITAGGTGKTPLVLTLFEKAKHNGRKPVILTRGYGGKTVGPYFVKSEDHAEIIGDEARLMASSASVVISRDRGEGARWIENNIPECDLIIMDDGMQNPTITPHKKIAVFNGSLGIGNGMIIPSGPLRERWSALKACDGVIISGDDKHNLQDEINALDAELPIFHVSRKLNKEDIADIKNKDIIAFAGIGDPRSFFNMLSSENINLVNTYIFPDHYNYSNNEILALKKEAEAKDALLVTTEKDYMRFDEEMGSGIKIIHLETILNESMMEILP